MSTGSGAYLRPMNAVHDVYGGGETPEHNGDILQPGEISKGCKTAWMRPGIVVAVLGTEPSEIRYVYDPEFQVFDPNYRRNEETHFVWVGNRPNQEGGGRWKGLIVKLPDYR